MNFVWQENCAYAENETKSAQTSSKICHFSKFGTLENVSFMAENWTGGISALISFRIGLGRNVYDKQQLLQLPNL